VKQALPPYMHRSRQWPRLRPPSTATSRLSLRFHEVPVSRCAHAMDPRTSRPGQTSVSVGWCLMKMLEAAVRASKPGAASVGGAFGSFFQDAKTTTMLCSGTA
jgi:hypothetical protein